MDKNVSQISIKAALPTSNGCAIFLDADSKIFVIYVEQSIGEAIQRAANEETNERPLTHDLMVTAFDGLGVEVERVVINDVKESTFFARLILSMENELGHKIIELDARPSDSIVLALNTRKPIYVANSVLEKVDDMTEILTKILQQNEDK